MSLIWIMILMLCFDLLKTFKHPGISIDLCLFILTVDHVNWEYPVSNGELLVLF